MVDHELDELKREFLGEADEKVREMKTVIATDGSPAGLERLAYLAHQLKGAGGSYGYQTISTEAAELEKAVERACATGKTAELDEAILRQVTSLESEIARRQSELVEDSA